MRKQFIKGNTVNERFDSINSHLAWFAKRLNKYVVGALPPIPVFDFVAEPEPGTGIILRRMFPGAGKIPKGAMFIEEYIGKGELTVNIRIDNDLGGMDAKVVTKQKMITIVPNFVVGAGHRLTVSVDPPTLVKNIWISFLYEVDFKNVVKQQFVLDELLELMDSQDVEPVVEPEPEV